MRQRICDPRFIVTVPAVVFRTLAAPEMTVLTVPASAVIDSGPRQVVIVQLAEGRFEPRPVAVARGNEKGRVERAIRYVGENFFAAHTFTDLADLNAQARR